MNLSELQCCEIKCKKVPQWVITNTEDDDPAGATHACTEHVGEMLSGDFNCVDMIGSQLTAEEMAG